MKQSLLACLCLLIASCASLGPKFVSAEPFDMQQSLLYVYRVSRFAGGGSSPYLCLDDHVIAELHNGSYLPLVLAPGEHKMEMRAWGITNGTFYFHLKAGNVYYARMDATLYNGVSEDGHPSQPDVAPYHQPGLIGAMAGGDADEAHSIRARVDKRAQVHSWNAGLLLIDPGLGDVEIRETRLLLLPHAEPKPCS